MIAGTTVLREAASVAVLVPDPARVVVAPATSVLLIAPDADHVTAAAERGPPGIQGPIGPSATDLQVMAGEDLGGQRAVIWAEGGLQYADPTSTDPTLQVIGITLGAAPAGTPALVRTGGPLDDPSFSFEPGQAVYLGPSGTLTQVQPQPPAASMDVPLGIALGPTVLLIRIGQAISLI